MIERPDIVDDVQLEYLDTLRESGETNMLGAGPYLEDTFLLSKEDAKTVLKYWMESFNERHKPMMLGENGNRSIFDDVDD